MPLLAKQVSISPVNNSKRTTTEAAWMRNNLHKYSTLGALLSSPLASLAAWASLVFFAASGSEASVVLICRILQSYRNDATIYDKRWVTYEDGGVGGRLGDIQVYPFLADLEAANNGLSYWQYWPKGYTQKNAPYCYAVKGNSNLNVTVPDDKAEYIPQIVAAFDTYSDSERACMNGIIIEYPSTDDGGILLTPTFYKPGVVVGNAVSTYDEQGRHVLSYPGQTGFIDGYVPTPEGTMRQVWYDTTGVSSGSQAVLLDSLNNTSSQDLVYDSDTGLYSFNVPDYSAQLSAINESVRRISFDGITVDIPPSQVTVNPEITVNPPAVTVNPEITVNPPAVTVNPEITVNPPEVNVSVDTDLTDVNDGLSAVNDSLDAIAESFYTPAIQSDFSNEVLTEEENALLDVVHGWETDIPVLGDAMDIGLNVLIGKIPQIDKKYELLNTELWGYQVKCDLNPYKDTILLFRAFFLLCELVWFFWVLWNDIHKALQV